MILGEEQSKTAFTKMGVSRIIFIQEALQKNFFFLLAFSIYWRHFPHSSVGKESACNAGNPDSTWVGKICWRRDRPPTPVFLGSPCGSAGEESACTVGDLGSIPGLGRSPGEGNSYPLQYSGLQSMGLQSQTRLSNSYRELRNQLSGL